MRPRAESGTGRGSGASGTTRTLANACSRTWTKAERAQGSPSDTDGSAMPSREEALLDRVESRARWGFVISVASALIGALLLATSSSVAAERLGFIAVFCGPLTALSFSRYRALFPDARECLREPPRE